jgi:uncharacterized protein
MLIQLAVENFLSFREKTVLSMRPAPNVARAPDAADVAGDVLRCAAIYGANASGKSNLVAALSFVCDLVDQDVSEHARIPVRPFRLHGAAERSPTGIELYIRGSSGRIYGYGIAVTRDRVHGEWLSEIREDREERLFERDEHGTRFFDALFADSAGEQQRALLEALSPGIRDAQLALCTARALKLERFPRPIQEVVEWFTYTVNITTPDSIDEILLSSMDIFPSLREFLSAVVASTGTGISSMSTIRRALRDDEHPDLFDGPGVFEYAGESFVERGDNKQRLCFVRAADGRRYQIELNLEHGTAEGPVQFSLQDESDGTVRLLDLAHILGGHLNARPRVYIIDELDRSMHTLLSRWLLEQFIAHAPPQRQLIFTTHDTNLLDLKSLRPDSIWFAEKDRNGASALHSLAEFKQEQLAALTGHLEEGYLQGRFGAIPFLGDPKRLGWPPKDEG